MTYRDTPPSRGPPQVPRCVRVTVTSPLRAQHGRAGRGTGGQANLAKPTLTRESRSPSL